MAPNAPAPTRPAGAFHTVMRTRPTTAIRMSSAGPSPRNTSKGLSRLRKHGRLMPFSFDRVPKRRFQFLNRRQSREDGPLRTSDHDGRRRDSPRRLLAEDVEPFTKFPAQFGNDFLF